MISVIVPYWNAAAWIGRCIESLKKQQGDFEFILVDDNSRDNGPEIARQMTESDDRFCCINNVNKRGPSGARNTGIVAAEGEWITVLDADDEMLDNAYETMVSVIAEDPRANIHQLNHLRYYTSIDKLTLKYTNECGTYSSKNLPDIWFGVWNKIIRREWLGDIRFNEKLRYGEDGLFVLECLAKDDYIHHARKKITTTKHRFDNKLSLSHIKTLKDLLTYIHELEAFILRTENVDVRLAACRVLGDEWTSPRLLKAVSKK